MFAQGVGQGGSTPEEHSAVPEIAAGTHEFLGALGVWLFRKTPYSSDAFSCLIAHFDIAVSGFGAIGCHTHDYDVFVLAGKRNGVPQNFPETVFIGDDVIGGE